MRPQYQPMASADASSESNHAEARPPSALAQLEPRSYDEGIRAGVLARLRKVPITPYQRVGLDDFVRGFRAGYFIHPARPQQAGDTAADRAAS